MNADIWDLYVEKDSITLICDDLEESKRCNFKGKMMGTEKIKEEIITNEFEYSGNKINILAIDKMNISFYEECVLILVTDFTAVLGPIEQNIKIIVPNPFALDINGAEFNWNGSELNYCGELQDNENIIEVSGIKEKNELIKVVEKIQKVINFCCMRENIMWKLYCSEIISTQYIDKLVWDDASILIQNIHIFKQRLKTVNIYYYFEASNLINEFLNVFAEFEVVIKSEMLFEKDPDAVNYKNANNRYEKQLKKEAKKISEEKNYNDEYINYYIFTHDERKNLPKLINEDKVVSEFESHLVKISIETDIKSLFVDANRIRNILFHNGPDRAIKDHNLEMFYLRKLSRLIRWYLAFNKICEMDSIDQKEKVVYLKRVHFQFIAYSKRVF